MAWLYSSDMAARQLLAPTSARAFLKELANLGDHPEALRRFRKLFGAWMPQLGYKRVGATIKQITNVTVIEGPEGSKTQRRQITVEEFEDDQLRSFRDSLQRVWKGRDERDRRYSLFVFLQHVYQYQAAARFWTAEPPLMSKLEAAVLYFLENTRTAQTCLNPECPARYFFASRRSQRYCSEACAVPAQREHKRQWWAKHGRVWRRQRRSARNLRKHQ
jgi:hypothetical protein